MIPYYNPMQLSEENVAICVSFAPMKTLSNSDGYFSGYTIFYDMTNIEIKILEIA